MERIPMSKRTEVEKSIVVWQVSQEKRRRKKAVSKDLKNRLRHIHYHHLILLCTVCSGMPPIVRFPIVIHSIQVGPSVPPHSIFVHSRCVNRASTIMVRHALMWTQVMYLIQPCPSVLQSIANEVKVESCEL
jgi:hypothetical protein